MKIKKIPLFYICLIVFAVIIIILTEFGKSYLKGLLKDYEDSQYKYVAEDFFKNNFSDGDSQTVYKLLSEKVSEYETEERIAAYVDEIAADKKYALQHSTVGLDDIEKYSVMCGNLKVAEFNLSKSGKKTEHNFDIYIPNNLIINEKLLHTYSIEIPEGYTLFANDFEVADSYISSSKENIVEKNLIGSTESVSVKYNVYTFPGFCYQPLFKAQAPSGEVCDIYLNEDEVLYAEYIFEEETSGFANEPEKTYDDETAKKLGEVLAGEYTDYIIDATKAYACYMQKDATFSRVSKYLDPSSDLYYKLSTSPNWMVISHHSYDFEDAEVFDFYVYNDDVFSCRIKITQVLKYNGLPDYRDYIDITWYLKKMSNGKYLIYDSYTNIG